MSNIRLKCIAILHYEISDGNEENILVPHFSFNIITVTLESGQRFVESSALYFK